VLEDSTHQVSDLRFGAVGPLDPVQPLFDCDGENEEDFRDKKVKKLM
jgi:hypothetical protein